MVVKKKAPKKKAVKKKAPDVEVFDPGTIDEEEGRGHLDPEIRTFTPPRIAGRPLKFPDVVALQNQIEMYFAFCNPHLEYVQTPVLKKNGEYAIAQVPTLTRQRPYTISGLAVFLDTTRDVLLDYEELAQKTPDKIPEGLRNANPKLLKEYSNTIKRAKEQVHAFVEEKLLGGGHPAGPIFNLKNNFSNWKDVQIVDDADGRALRERVDQTREELSQLLKSVKPKKK